jgi:hypothetical protein
MRFYCCAKVVSYPRVGSMRAVMDTVMDTATMVSIRRTEALHQLLQCSRHYAPTNQPTNRTNKQTNNELACSTQHTRVHQQRASNETAHTSVLCAHLRNFASIKPSNRGREQ